MDANDQTLNAILNTGDRYIIPVFQRYYVWGESNWEQLWEDVHGVAFEDNDEDRHFLGAIVCVPEAPRPGHSTDYQIIDGQQRMMTLSILFAALRDAAYDMGWEKLGDEVHDNYLVHQYKEGEKHYKVFPRMRDRGSYVSVIDGDIDDPGSTLAEAYEFFRAKLDTEDVAGTREDLENLFRSLENLIDIVIITLDDESPYKIFKSLNSTGIDLEEGDLIRNHVFMSMDVEKQDRFDDDYWQPLEKHFQKEDGKLDGSLFADFFRDAMMRTGDYIPQDSTYEAFEERHPFEECEPVEVAEEFLEQAAAYDIVRGERSHPDEAVDSNLSDLRDLDVSTTYPLVLQLLERERKGDMTAEEVATALEMVKGFVLRRYICGESSRTYYLWFVNACGELGDAPLENLREYLTDKGWPGERQFVEDFVRYPVYQGKYSREVLEKLEREAQTESERVVLEECHIEHVMPQTITDDDDGRAWKRALGEDWEEKHEQWLHTPGNLTLVGHDYNEEMQKKPFDQKQPVLADSKIYLNEYFEGLEADSSGWNVEAIRERGRGLANAAAKLWRGPAAFDF